MPFELRVVEAALDVVSPLTVPFSCRLRSFSEHSHPSNEIDQMSCAHAVYSE